MNTLEIIRNGLMQCIEKIEALLKRISKTEKTVEEQGNKIKDGYNDAKISLSVVENFASSQFANFTYLYYTENGGIKSMLFNDGNVDRPNVPNYTISGKPVSYRCSESTSKVVFKDFDTSAVTNMSSMFNYCQNLTTLDVTNFNTAAVTDMSSMFNYCRSLTTLDLSNFNTAAVTNMSYMFNYCQNLTTLDVTNFNTAAVTNMSSMFNYCQNLTTLDVTNFNTAAVTDMSSMFNYCRSLTTLDLSNFNTAAVTNMSYMFNSCRSLSTLDLSNFNTSAVTNMRSMFSYCNNLTTIIGTHTLEEVQLGTIKAMRGLKVSISFSDSPNLERASILALFYGLADLTGQTAQTVTLHATAKARLTAEDIKIATDKNWKVQ